MDTWTIFLAICFLLLSLILTISILVVFSGVMENIELKTGKPPIGAVTIAYKFSRGAYGALGPLFLDVARIAPDNKAIGIYYDDPSNKEKPHLRYVVACILAEDGKDADQELLKKFEADGFKIMDLPLVDNAVHTSFPYKFLLSVFVGLNRIYPKMVEYIKEHGLQAHPFIEIYAGDTIYYMSPLDNQEKFYVPESLQQLPDESYEAAYSSEPSQDSLKEDSQLTEGNTDRPEGESLLHPSQIMRAEVIGKVEEELEKTAGDEEEVKKTAEEAEGKEDSPGPDSSSLTGEAEKEQGSDEDSGSSFEDLKLEAEEVCKEPHSQ